MTTARARHGYESKSFEKTEFFFTKLIWNIGSKQREVNGAGVKVPFIVKSANK